MFHILVFESNCYLLRVKGWFENLFNAAASGGRIQRGGIAVDHSALFSLTYFETEICYNK